MKDKVILSWKTLCAYNCRVCTTHYYENGKVNWMDLVKLTRRGQWGPYKEIHPTEIKYTETLILHAMFSY